MYKSKFKVWILLLLLSFILGSIGKIKDFFSAENFNAYVSIEDNSLRNKFNGYKKSNAKITLVSDINNSDIIIKDSSDEKIDGYVKYSKQFTSPIVMFVPYDAYDIENSGFNKDSISTTWSTHYYIQKDLKIILEAIENDKSYTDIGINKEVFGDTKVQIAIPDKNNCYYTAGNKVVCYNIKSMPLLIRHREDGDRIRRKRVNKVTKEVHYYTQKVSDVLTNKKISYLDRLNTLVVTNEQNEVIIIVGLTIS